MRLKVMDMNGFSVVVHLLCDFRETTDRTACSYLVKLCQDQEARLFCWRKLFSMRFTVFFIDYNDLHILIYMISPAS